MRVCMRAYMQYIHTYIVYARRVRRTCLSSLLFSYPPQPPPPPSDGLASVAENKKAVGGQDTTGDRLQSMDDGKELTCVRIARYKTRTDDSRLLTADCGLRTVGCCCRRCCCYCCMFQMTPPPSAWLPQTALPTGPSPLPPPSPRLVGQEENGIGTPFIRTTRTRGRMQSVLTGVSGWFPLPTF